MHTNWYLSKYELATEQLIMSHRNLVEFIVLRTNIPFVWGRGLNAHTILSQSFSIKLFGTFGQMFLEIRKCSKNMV